MSGAASFEQNQADARLHLARFAHATVGHVIGGVPVPSSSGETFANHSPIDGAHLGDCLLYTSPSPRDRTRSRMPSSA